ncbi:MAG: AMIN domain-containing protein, partial [Terriglobales bacterium]
MRLKQQLIVLVLLVCAGKAGHASASKLTEVNVASQGNTTSVTLRLDGAFTHNEYRPTESLLLVDLVGVSADELREHSRELKMPGVRSYHVTGYSGTSGAPIARLELTLDAHPDVQVKAGPEGLLISVISKERLSQAPSIVASTKPATEGPGLAPRAGSPQLKQVAVRSGAAPVMVRNVSVDRGTDKVDINIFLSGPISPNVFKITDPDRIVMDLPNSEPGKVARAFPVQAFGVKDVRVGRLQDNPPITRVVLDLSAACEFDLVRGDNKLALRVHPSGEAALSKSPTPPVRTPSEQLSVAGAISTPDAGLNSAVAAPSSASDIRLEPPSSEPAISKPPVTPVNQPAEQPIPSAATTNSDANRPIAMPVPASASEVKPEAPQAAAVVAVSMPSRLPDGNVGSNTSSASAKPESPPAPSDFVVVAPSVQQHISDKNPDQQPVQMAAANPASAAAPGTIPAPPVPQSPAALQNQSAPVSATDANADSVKQRGVNFALDQQQQQGAPQPDFRPRYTGEPISVNLKDVDLKDFFRLIHEISGLNVVLDPNVSGSLTLVLDDVPWDQALDIVLKNNGLDKQLDGTVLRVATRETLRQEAEARRHQIEAQNLAVDKVTATRFLSYAHAKDVMPTVKKLLSVRGDVIADDRTNALVISDIPSIIAGIDNLLIKLDRKTLQVEIEARVVSATRSFARDIGTQLGFGFGNASTSLGGASAVGQSPNQVGYINPPGYQTNPGITPSTSGTPTTTFASIPLFSNLAATAPTS